MLLNKETIENLSVNKQGADYWNTIKKNISENFGQIINNPYFDNYLKTKLDISFEFDSEDKPKIDGPNAYAGKLENKKYEIVISRELLILMRHYSYKIIDYSLLFSELERCEKNKKTLSQVSDIIFYFWMDFICLHEWSHIVKGHLEDYDNNNSTKKLHFEFGKLCEDNEDSIYLEIDADRNAGKIMFGRFAWSIPRIQEVLNVDESEIVFNFCIGMLYLFDLIFFIGGNNRQCHPSPVDRMMILGASMSEALHIKHDILKMSEKELNKIVERSAQRFILEYHIDYKLNASKMLNEFPKLLEEYTKKMKDLKLSNYDFIK
ncbi:hypothetical protein [Sulfurimonas diazotrophicus]|uniref:Peptidase M48 domain-containing protein n=1 Tax=Sulfurimonas diazotrophicus TaxID=3131939 RepID=A0ABZ3H620_9BACT